MSSGILSIGSYSFPAGRSWYTQRIRGIVGQTGRRNLLHVVWDMHSSVSGSSESDITTAMDAVDAAMVDDVNIAFDVNNQGLTSSNTTTGTHLRHFEWIPGYDGVRGSGAEGILRRTCHIVYDGLLPQTSDTDLVVWQESVTGIGTGGPRILPVGSLAGAVQAQQVQALTPYFAIQSGFAIGLLATPPAATPLWSNGGPVYWMPERFRNSVYTPQNIGLYTSTMFKTSWSYQFWSAAAIVGGPTPMP